jgi:hypothetical protein
VDDLEFLVEQLRAQREDDNIAADKLASGQLAGAGIMGGTQLLGGLYAQKAAEGIQARERTMKMNELTAKTKGQVAEQSAQEQQDAFTRLMGSMRSALVR